MERAYFLLYEIPGWRIKNQTQYNCVIQVIFNLKYKLYTAELLCKLVSCLQDVAFIYALCVLPVGNDWKLWYFPSKSELSQVWEICRWTRSAIKKKKSSWRASAQTLWTLQLTPASHCQKVPSMLSSIRVLEICSCALRAPDGYMCTPDI